MAVVAMWKCDRDGSMFENKKDADAHDKMLELAEGFAELMNVAMPKADERLVEDFSILLASNRDLISQACKGKPAVLSDLASQLAQRAVNGKDTIAKLKAVE